MNLVRSMSWFAIVIAVPTVWAIGYQDHPTRNPGLAVAVGISLVVAAAALSLVDDGERSRLLAVATWVMTVAALVLAVTWSAINRMGAY